MALNPFKHAPVVMQQHTTIEQSKEQYKKQKRTNSEGTKVMHGRVNLFMHIVVMQQQVTANGT